MHTDAIHSQTPPADNETIGMPSPTAAPLVASVGLILLAAGAVTNVALLAIGAALLLIGLGMWIEHLLPGRGHLHEPLAVPSMRPALVIGAPGKVATLRAGLPGYRLRLPEKVHPISAGIKGGIVGGIVMPLPALAYGMLSGHGIWYPVNLLAGTVLPGLNQMNIPELEQFHFGFVAFAMVIHVVMCVVLGMIYGVLMPTLPDIPQPLVWGALLAPMLWTGVSFALLAAVNPVLYQGIEWPWFIASQFIFGVVLAAVVMRAHGLHPLSAGVRGALCGGLVMPLPAMLWGQLSGHGIWYPVNLLAGLVMPGLDQLPLAELTKFHAGWLLAATGIHAAISLTFGVAFGLLLPRLPPIPGPIAWGVLLLPLVWTAMSYSMMGVVNPLLEERVDWPWFITSQVAFGLAAALVVVRSEMLQVPPAGRGQPSLVHSVGEQS
jgi:hypothetical protein